MPAWRRWEGSSPMPSGFMTWSAMPPNGWRTAGTRIMTAPPPTAPPGSAAALATLAKCAAARFLIYRSPSARPKDSRTKRTRSSTRSDSGWPDPFNLDARPHASRRNWSGQAKSDRGDPRQCGIEIALGRAQAGGQIVVGTATHRARFAVALSNPGGAVGGSAFIALVPAILDPFGGIADCVIKPKGIGLEPTHRRQAGVAVVAIRDRRPIILLLAAEIGHVCVFAKPQRIIAEVI